MPKMDTRTMTLLMALCLVPSVSFAVTQRFVVSYSKNSAAEGPALVKNDLRLEIHANGRKLGLITVHTDDKQSFVVDLKQQAYVTVHVLSVEGEAKFNLRCEGYSTLNQDQIPITCVKNQFITDPHKAKQN